tara:strand:+ start:148 stop:1050 length:903 start_codon:yes stop_codon:yes gene_type:complete
MIFFLQFVLNKMSKKPLDRLVLGTAQFNNKAYGIGNNSKLREDLIFKILNYAWDNGIKNFDTAEGYNCNKVLKKFIERKKIHKKIRIISKISKLKKKNFEQQIKDFLNTLYSELPIKKLVCLLFHEQKDLKILIKNKKNFLKILKEYNVESFGLSVYNKKFANLFLKNFKRGSLQFPFNILNTNFSDLKKKNSIFYARSIFLQGLLTEKKIFTKNRHLLKKHKEYFQYLKINKIDPVNLCLYFVLNNINNDFVIFGVKNLSQLKTIFNSANAFQASIKQDIHLNKIRKFFIKKQLDPRNW